MFIVFICVECSSGVTPDYYTNLLARRVYEALLVIHALAGSRDNRGIFDRRGLAWMPR